MMPGMTFIHSLGSKQQLTNLCCHGKWPWYVCLGLSVFVICSVCIVMQVQSMSLTVIFAIAQVLALVW